MEFRHLEGAWGPPLLGSTAPCWLYRQAQGLEVLFCPLLVTSVATARTVGAGSLVLPSWVALGQVLAWLSGRLGGLGKCLSGSQFPSSAQFAG